MGSSGTFSQPSSSHWFSVFTSRETRHARSFFTPIGTEGAVDSPGSSSSNSSIFFWACVPSMAVAEMHAPVILFGAFTLLWPQVSTAEELPPCVAFRGASDCSPAGARDPRLDAPCDSVVRADWAGFCECAGFTTADVGCGQAERTCAAACEEAVLREGGAGAGSTSAAAGPEGAAAGAPAAASPRTVGGADSDLENLYKRGKQFYVVGNIELALRHYREALRLDPDHAASKADHKKLKKLQKAMAEAEAKLPRTVEGGRKVQLEQRDNALLALQALDAALAVAPPAVYRAELYAHLCRCHTTLKKSEDALASCAEHMRLDGGSAGSRLFMAEAHLLSDQLELARAQYAAIVEADQNSRQAREGIALVERLQRRAAEDDHYRTLGVGRSATEKEIKRAYHKAAVQYHPDKFVGAADSADAAAADAQFKKIARAYEVLSDEELRRKYDLGEDPDEARRQQGQGQQGGFRPMHHRGQRVHMHFG